MSLTMFMDNGKKSCQHENVDWITRTGGKCSDCGDIVFRDEITGELEKVVRRNDNA